MRFGRLTPHQREKLEAVAERRVAVLLAPLAAARRTWQSSALWRLLNEDDATVLFVARNEALALFFCKWLVVASHKSAEHVGCARSRAGGTFFERTAPRARRGAGGRRRLVFGNSRVDAPTYALIVIDEAHHLVGDSSLRSQLAELGAAKSSLLFLGDASQATATHKPDHTSAWWSCRQSARSSSRRFRSSDRRSASLRELAAFQLEAGRKAASPLTHGAGRAAARGRVFTTSKGDYSGEAYAREVVEALAAIRRQLVDLEDLDDGVAVVGPDDAFVGRLREPLARALGTRFKLVDAATASAVLPRRN